MICRFTDFSLFRCSIASVSAATLHEMNPLVKLSAREGPATASKDLIADYDLMLIVGRPLGSLVLWDTLCRDNHVAFFAGISRGGLACFFSDLGSHSYSPVVRSAHLILLMSMACSAWCGI